MKKILTTGLLVVVSVGILCYLLKAIIANVLPSFFGPLIVFLGGSEALIIPLSLVFTFLLILLIGFIFSRVRFRKIIDKVLNRTLPGDIERKRGALVKLCPDGARFIGAITKEVELKERNGTKKQYILFCPSAPIPVTGLPIIVAGEELVTPLKISYGELYGIVSSFGMNTPKLLEEMEEKIKSAD